MTKLLYCALVTHMFAFALCVIAFTNTSDIFQYALAVFNLGMLFNVLRIAAKLEL